MRLLRIIACTFFVAATIADVWGKMHYSKAKFLKVTAIRERDAAADQAAHVVLGHHRPRGLVAHVHHA